MSEKYTLGGTFIESINIKFKLLGNIEDVGDWCNVVL